MKIEVKNVTKKFKKDIVLNVVSHTFESGKIYGIYGRNGSGKSVFLKVLCTYYVPTSGEVLIDGVDYSKSTKYPKNMGVLIDKPSFFEDINGFKNLELLANIQKIVSKKGIEESMNIVHLENNKKKVKDYSLGMKQKLGIAQAIMENPNIIILDEPFNGVERESVKAITEYLKKNKKDKIIIISSHIKEDLVDIADEFLYFDNGVVTLEDSLNEL